MGRGNTCQFCVQITSSSDTNNLWRGSLLPLEREALPKPEDAVCQMYDLDQMGLLRNPAGASSLATKAHTIQLLDLVGNIQINPLAFARS